MRNNNLIIREVLHNFIKNKCKKPLKESEFNYHIGKIDDISNIKPYYSDNKHQMQGRDTGHFGSGMYFSTYEGKYTNDEITDNKLIQIGNNVYRVDFDLYKNLYRVTSERHGDMLFFTLKNLNDLFYKVGKNDFNCRKNYLIISRNCQALGLNCPSYKDLIRMAIQLYNNNSDERSFSTWFMEYNGYNGVNVSNIFKYDNTLHGSVIYDLSKINQDSIQRVNIKNEKIPFLDASVASDNEIDDIEYDILRDKGNLSCYHLKDLPVSTVLKLLKTSSYIVSDLNSMKFYFDDNFIKHYLKLIYSKINKGLINNSEVLYERSSIELLYDLKAFYMINIQPINNRSQYGSLLLCLINEALYDNNPEVIIKEILNYLNRDLTLFEENTIRSWLGDIDIKLEK